MTSQTTFPNSRVYFYVGSNEKIKASILSLVDGLGLVNFSFLTREHIPISRSIEMGKMCIIIFEVDENFERLRGVGAWCFSKYANQNLFYRNSITVGSDNSQKSFPLSIYFAWNKFYKGLKYRGDIKNMMKVINILTHYKSTEGRSIFFTDPNDGSNPNLDIISRVMESDQDLCTLLLTNDSAFLFFIAEKFDVKRNSLLDNFKVRAKKLMNGSRLAKCYILGVLYDDRLLLDELNKLYKEDFFSNGPLLFPKSDDIKCNPLITPVTLCFLAAAFPHRFLQTWESVCDQIRRLFSEDDLGEEPFNVEAIFEEGSRTLSSRLRDDLLYSLNLPSLIDEFWVLSPKIFAKADVWENVLDAWKEFLKRCASVQSPRIFVRRPVRERPIVALRFDVDRPISKEQYSLLNQLICKYAGYGAASFYFRPELESSHNIMSPVLSDGYEVGTHISRLGQAVKGKNFNFHGGWESEYWQGREGLELAFDLGCSYYENLFLNIRHPVILSNPKCIEQRLVLLPIYRAIEGSTDGSISHEYDNLFISMEEMGKSESGAFVLGTHPDIKLNTLERWLEHLAMRGFEFMSVANLASTVLNTSVLNIIQYTVDSSAKRINLTAKPGFKLDTLEVFESPMSVCEYSVSVS